MNKHSAAMIRGIQRFGWSCGLREPACDQGHADDFAAESPDDSLGSRFDSIRGGFESVLLQAKECQLESGVGHLAILASIFRHPIAGRNAAEIHESIPVFADEFMSFDQSLS